MNELQKITLQQINHLLSMAPPEDTKGQLLLLKAELSAADPGQITILSIMTRICLDMMREKADLCAKTELQIRAFNDLKTSVNQNKASLRNFNSKIQKFKSQRNRFFKTLDDIYASLQQYRKNDVNDSF
jgi:hypothetical protein